MPNPVEEKFSEFHEKWVSKLEEIVKELLEVITKQRNGVVTSEQDLQALVTKVTSHLKEYYSVKWGAAQEDVMVFFSPVWLNPLENANLWVTGFKPSTTFNLVDTLKKPREGNNTFVLTEEQLRKIEELKKRTRMEENKVEMDMERAQVAMADRKMMHLVKMFCRAKDGDGVAVAAQEVGLKDVNASLEKVTKTADCVRLKTLKGVLDVLTPMQSVEFLTTHIAMLLRLRQWGNVNDIAGPAGNQDK